MLKEMQSSESMVHCVRAIPQILNLRLYFNHFYRAAWNADAV